MAFVFNADEGGSAANSYATVAYADDYFGGELYAAEWTALYNTVPADLLKKQQALVKATRRLERLEYKGHAAAYSAQRLKHPRYGLQNDEGYYYSASAIIEQLKTACVELALYYLKQDPADLVDESLKQFKHLRIAGAVEMEMRDVLPDGEQIPAHIMSLIYPHIVAGSGITRIIRA